MNGMAIHCIIGIRVMSYVSIYDLIKYSPAIANIVFMLDVLLYTLWFVCVYIYCLAELGNIFLSCSITSRSQSSFFGTSWFAFTRFNTSNFNKPPKPQPWLILDWSLRTFNLFTYRHTSEYCCVQFNSFTSHLSRFNEINVYMHHSNYDKWSFVTIFQ